MPRRFKKRIPVKLIPLNSPDVLNKNDLEIPFELNIY
jgi:hypothetical protein